VTAVALLLSIAAAVPPAGAADPCTTPASFSGQVIIGSLVPGTVELEWTTWEDGSTREYRVSRRPSGCDRPSCLTRLGKVRAAGHAAASKTYALIDTAPPGAWVYRLEVRRTAGQSCKMETPEILISAPPPCDLAALCAQVEASFVGEVITGAAMPRAIELQWATHAETGAGTYRLSRSDCAVPRACTTELATINSTGTCGDVMLHSVTDRPPEGEWTYVLDVLDSGDRTACSLRLPAPAAPASSR
jgi:hypothetical protein